MNYQSLTPHDATGLLSLVGLVVLFIGLLFLIRRTQQKRLQQAQAAPAAAAKPFPQNLEARLQILPDSGEQRQERLAQLRQAYADWQSAYWLRGLDGATEFLRGQTTKRGLRYQISATSLVQGLAMLIQTQMAEKDDDSCAGFERLLACLLSRPAQDFPALSSWLFMPDLPTSPRLQSDLHAEAWILSALLAANKLTVNSLIYPGMLLNVPAGGKLPAVAATNAAAGTSTTDSRIAKVLAFAQAQLGEPYKFNAAGPDSWDCSGLTMAAYAEIGISLPHYSGAQVEYGTAVDRATQAIKAGDLIFLESSVGSGVINHVGIAINSTQWIQAPRSGDVVRVGSIPSTRVIAIRRLVSTG